MVSSHSFTELQLLKSGMALSISVGLLNLRPRKRQIATDRQRRREMNGRITRLVGGSLKMRKKAKGEQEAERPGERGALKCAGNRGRKSITVEMIEKRRLLWVD